MQKTLQLAPLPSSARTARAVVRELFAGIPAGPSVVDTALLLTSELVMNVVRHGEGDATLDARLADNRIRIAVTDAGAGRPTVERTEGRFSDRGRGLLLVEEFATCWGVEPAGAGKTVWFELAFLCPAG